MKNTFYRLNKVDVNEFDSIVSKMKSDLLELTSCDASKTDAFEYAKKTICDAKPLKDNSDMVFWGLSDPQSMPSDARVDYLYIPTYYSVAILAYIMLKWPKEAEKQDKFTEILGQGLKASTGRDFCGHGYDALAGLIECMDIFSSAHMQEFVERFPNVCPEFTSMFRKAIVLLAHGVEKETLKNEWGEDYSEKASQVLQNLRDQAVS